MTTRLTATLLCASCGVREFQLVCAKCGRPDCRTDLGKGCGARAWVYVEVKR